VIGRANEILLNSDDWCPAVTVMMVEEEKKGRGVIPTDARYVTV
jgi:hypothetical protein